MHCVILWFAAFLAFFIIKLSKIFNKLICTGQQMCRNLNYSHSQIRQSYNRSLFCQKTRPDKAFSKNLLNHLLLEALSFLPDVILHACVNPCLQSYWKTLSMCEFQCELHKASCLNL